MMQQVQAGKLRGSLSIPPSKSDAQRAILAAALVEGTSELYNVGSSNDELAMLRNIEMLGAHAEKGDKIKITGIDVFPDEVHLNVGESGLGLRLITAICAVFEGVKYINGEGSILTRSQGFFEEHLAQSGIKVISNRGFLPLKIAGKLNAGQITIDGSMSSQYLSGLLMALPLLNEDSVIIVNNLKSYPYVRMTLDTLQAFGIEIHHENLERFVIPGNQQYQPVKYAVESDWSSASCWLAAAALGHDINLIGLSLDSHQADTAMLEALVAANCSVTADSTGITVCGVERKGFNFDATHCPDLFPALVALAVHSEGETIISGVDRLKNKESDRGVVLRNEFTKLGASIELNGNQMVIQGGLPLKSADVDANNDHRIAMCLAIAALQIEGGLTIHGAEAVKKSYPGFWKDLAALS